VRGPTALALPPGRDAAAHPRNEPALRDHTVAERLRVVGAASAGIGYLIGGLGPHLF
jgi:hypothetical protein